ncbi:YceI family protein [Sphingobium algorifonticola]|uniref:Polyisoprenoid-binding protein n=1 Tax=Sphingobium algorifonticola TaxID=2008318 RepID=A0A437J6L9_9SPHN|nr:YceI family protein [Sphingobium algorifonticola]RVT40789.1 polyisoprenoid-binding protein [Sphingobium algorifonticola]
MRRYLAPAALALGLLALSPLALAPVTAQNAAAQRPGQPDPARVTAGTYTIDGNHTQAVFAYDHLGFTSNAGIISGFTGSLVLDPRAPETSKLTVDIPIATLQTGIPKFQEHLASADFFDFAKFPTAKFVATGIKVDGTTADITGDLTLHGVTKSITLDAKFVGAGMSMQKKETVGFAATGVIKRSDFGLGKYAPMVSDEVELKIVAAFEK